MPIGKHTKKSISKSTSEAESSEATLRYKLPGNVLESAVEWTIEPVPTQDADTDLDLDDF